jgi:polysaccharide export outer membrane protein
MKKKVHLVFLVRLAALVVVFSSCTSKKKLLYFQADSQLPASSENYNPIFKKDDLLSIMVLGLNPDAVVPFNLPATMYFTNTMGGYYQGAPTPPGYLIDVEGNIDFPVIGKIHLEGLSRSQAIELLKQKLSEYITKPSVNLRILNYKVTVLGEVKNPGTFTIPNERVTLPEALGIAGDLLITGKRNNVLVIREVDGKKSEFRLDLTAKDVFASPAYYLQQNDIVYVSPNRSKINSSVVNSTNVSIGISVLSLLITVTTLLTR